MIRYLQVAGDRAAEIPTTFRTAPHQHLSSIQKKDLIPANWTKAAWHPPFGMPPALRGQLWPAQNCSLQKSDTGLAERPYHTTEMPAQQPGSSLVRLARK